MTLSTQENTATPAPGASSSRRPAISRRKVIVGSGAGLLVLLSGGIIWRAVDQGVFSTGEGPAYEPWEQWHTATKGPLDLVRAAILAANPHDSQPWLFRVRKTQLDLFADHQRNLGHIDPLLREMHIGLGCALENLLLAAATNGYATQVTLLPDPADATAVARIELAPGATNVTDLYQAIARRHTNRYPYDSTRPVATATLDALHALNDDTDVTVFWFTSSDERKRVADLMVAAAKALVADKVQNEDSARWMRNNWQEVQQHRSGITLDVQGLSDLQRAFGKILPSLPQDQQDDFFIQNTEQQARSAGVLGLLAVRQSHDNAQRMRAGRLWQRMHLWATVHGLAMQPMNQIAERADRETTQGIPPRFGDALKTLIGSSSWEPLMPFRLGYPTHEALRSPRRALHDVLRT
ncbi:MAG: hypothetical protein E6J34_19180 [Chloroflexi bacterium]|nr:MAG: hypothetical protein E6J34_19180 [Chloroflexota bacterium]